MSDEKAGEVPQRSDPFVQSGATPVGRGMYMLQFRHSNRLGESYSWVDMWGSWHDLETQQIPLPELVRMYKEQSGGEYRILVASVTGVVE